MIRKIYDHLANWLEVYLWVPVSLLGIFGAAQLSYFLTGRRPVENADWLVDYSSKSVQIIAIIALTSIAKEALGHWMTMDERKAHPFLAVVNTFATLVTFLAIIYAWIH